MLATETQARLQPIVDKSKARVTGPFTVEAGPAAARLVLFAAFQFDPEAAKDIDETNWPGATLLKVQMNADLLTNDLKKKPEEQ